MQDNAEKPVGGGGVCEGGARTSRGQPGLRIGAQHNKRMMEVDDMTFTLAVPALKAEAGALAQRSRAGVGPVFDQ